MFNTDIFLPLPGKWLLAVNSLVFGFCVCVCFVCVWCLFVFLFFVFRVFVRVWGGGGGGGGRDGCCSSSSSSSSSLVLVCSLFVCFVVSVSFCSVVCWGVLSPVTSERRGRAYMGFTERIDTILNRTELS